MRTSLKLGDTRYFETFIGTRILKETVFQSKAEIPAYSANVMEPFGFVKLSNLPHFEVDSILWSIDGNFEFNLFKAGYKFATTDHCGTLRILDNSVIPEYLLIELRRKCKQLGFDRGLRSSLKNMREVDIEIPVDESGNFNTSIQQKIVHEFAILQTVKTGLLECLQQLNCTDLTLPNHTTHLTIQVSNLFDLSKRSNGSYFTKDFINKHPGKIPVFSATKNANDAKYGYVADELPGVKYFENCLTWNIDGSSGRAFFHEGRFSLSEKVIPLVLRKEWQDKISPEYVGFALEHAAKNSEFGFGNKAGKTRIKDIKLRIPAQKIGGSRLIPDFELQKRLAKNFAAIHHNHRILKEDIEEVSKLVVIPSI